MKILVSTDMLPLLCVFLSMIEFSISSRITLSKFLHSSSIQYNVASAIEAICEASIEIQSLIRFPPSFHAPISSSTNTNASGEEQKPLDLVSDSIIAKALQKCPSVAVYASEELDEAMILRSQDGTIAVLCDPLDGSSNVDCNIPTGTIFTIVTMGADCECVALTDLLINRKHISSSSSSSLGIGASVLAAGYILYSSSTELVLNPSKGCGVQGFTLDPFNNEFVLTRTSIKCPLRGPYYSLNEGKSDDWPPGLSDYIADIKAGRGSWGRRYGIRYVCSLVADIHRTLLYGGWAGNPRAHLRLLFESVAMATLLKEAEGKATEGTMDILDVVPTKLHDRLPLFAGSRDDVLEIMARGDCAQ